MVHRNSRTYNRSGAKANPHCYIKCTFEVLLAELDSLRILMHCKRSANNNGFNLYIESRERKRERKESTNYINIVFK